MKCDYEYLKRILQIIEDNPSSRILNSDLFGKSIPLAKDAALLDIFIGHIKLLIENGLIEADNKFGNIGYSYGYNQNIISVRAYYRITSRGHDFLAGLKRRGIMSKIKNKAIPVGIKILTDVLTEYIAGVIGKAGQNL